MCIIILVNFFFSIFIYIFWLPGSVLNINYLTFNLLCYQLFTTITVDEPAPGLKTIFSFKVPDQRSGKVSYLFVYLLSLSLSCFPENAKNLWIHALRNSSALYRFTDMQMLTIVISAHFDNCILTGGNTVFAWLCSCKLKRWVDSKPDC